MAMSALLYVVQEAIVKVLTTDLEPIDIVFFRNAFGLLFMVPLVIKQGLGSLKVVNKKLLGLRAVFGFCAMLTYTYALKYESFLSVGTISLLVPIVSAVLTLLFLNEPANPFSYIALFFAFVGALMVVNAQGDFRFDWNYGILFAVASVIFNAGIFVIVKLLTKTESNVTISVWLCITQMTVAFPFVLFDWQWPSWSTLSGLAAMGCLTALAQMAFAQALRTEHVQVIIPSSFFRLVWVLLIGIFFFNEKAYFFSIIGAFLILMANLSMVFRNQT